MKTVLDVLTLATGYFEKSCVERPRFIAEHLLSGCLGVKRIELYMYADRPLQEFELVAYRESIKRKMAGEPLEQIMGSIEFFGAVIQVAPCALIPRPETEILVDLIKKRILDEPQKVLDLCTGTGCIAIALKKALPTLDIVGVDLSSEALDLAKANGEQNGVQIDWRHGDLCEPVIHEKFDLIVCNPPYISEEDYVQLDPSSKEYEPKMALVSGPSGYEFFERLARDLPLICMPGAQVFFELGTGQGSHVKALFPGSIWQKKIVEPDWAGHDRFFSSIFLEKQ